MTKEDIERQLQKQAAATTTEITTKTGNTAVNAEEDESSEAPEEYVFGLDDAAPHKVKSSTALASTRALAGVKSKSVKKSAPKSIKIKATAKTSTMNTTK